MFSNRYFLVDQKKFLPSILTLLSFVCTFVGDEHDILPLPFSKDKTKGLFTP